ncbi:hypothetical protein CG740_12580 [Streptomyces sp. CB01201]|uniref:hypothetical protein n=1 Tax=Streptomyces sp. CB01201 TaxID=2020324 RepID=UPI000C27674C|nr:hypothetical protein [Streptomyces sp. CB01201]PJN02635.1 hypothetical protein CG740_12580 [Streptomyces sp. CB01201]
MEPNGVPARGEPPARPRLPGRRAEPGPDRTTCPDASSGPGTPPSDAEVLGLCAAAERALPGGAPPLAPDLLLAAAQLGWRVQAGAAARERIVALAAPPAGSECEPRRIATLALAQPVRQAALVTAQLGRFHTERVSDADDLWMLGTAAHAVGEPVLAVDCIDRAETLLRDQGRPGPPPHALVVRAQALLDLGDWHRAARTTEEIRRLAADDPEPPECVADALTVGAQAAALSGDTAAALRLTDRAGSLRSEGPSAVAATRARLVRAIAACSDERHDDAYALLRALFTEERGIVPDPPDPPGPSDPSERDRRDPCPPDRHGPALHAPDPNGPQPRPPHRYGFDLNPPAPDGGSGCRESFGAIGFLAEAAVALDRRGEAAAVVASLTRRTAGSPASLLRVQLRYAAAVLADDMEAETLFRRALADNLARWPWPRARAECAYGSWLRAQRRTAEACPLLRSARLGFERIGARPWAERAAEELRNAGGSPRRPG